MKFFSLFLIFSGKDRGDEGCVSSLFSIVIFGSINKFLSAPAIF